MATGEGLLPDTPMVLAAFPRAISPDELDDESLCFAMGVAPGGLVPALAAEFDRRFLPNRLERLSCLDLVAALVSYPLEKGDGSRFFTGRRLPEP
jgi:hypothetical protein